MIDEQRRTRSIETIEQWLSSKTFPSRPLSVSELQAYRSRRFDDGWRVTFSIASKAHEIDILADSRFPWSAPRIAVVGASLFREWPHVESDNILCLLPGSAEVDPDNPVSVLKCLLTDTVALIEGSVEGRFENDFRDEFRSYWPHDEGAAVAVSLLKPHGPSRLVAVRENHPSVYFAEDAASLIRWLNNLYNAGVARTETTTDGALIWLERALLPSEYPTTAASLMALCEAYAPAGAKILKDLGKAMPSTINVLLGANTANGPALAAVEIKKPGPIPRGRTARIDPTTKGFRKGKMPPQLAAKMMFGGNRIAKAQADRADAAWIHGRGNDPHQSALYGKTVTLIGCGSIGSSVAELLTRAGVGGLTLIDPEPLSWANIGRHALGASSVGQNKAKALAASLSSSYPHVRSIDAKPVKWHALVEQEDTAPITDTDLVVSTVGSWGVEGAFNSWHQSHANRQPVIYGWTEPHACAGHAVAIYPPTGCFACGLGPTGKPKLQVTEWADGNSQLQEPACGAVYQPYGPIDLSLVVALVANTGIDMLLGRISESTHRIWSGRRSAIEAVGSNFTEAWTAITPSSEEGCLMERPWVRSDACSTCGGKSVP